MVILKKKICQAKNYLKNQSNQLLISTKCKTKFHPSYKDDNWGADLPVMQLISRFNKGIRSLLCVINIFSKYAWVVSLKDKKGITVTKTFQEISDDSNRRTNKIWVDNGSEFYNRSMKSWLRDNDIEMYSTHNEEKFVAAERFIRILKNKIYKNMTSISKNVYIDKLADIVNTYHNKYHNTIKMTSTDVKSSTYIVSKKENNNEDHKFEKW